MKYDYIFIVFLFVERKLSQAAIEVNNTNLIRPWSHPIRGHMLQ
jgi:hypothetical protein